MVDGNFAREDQRRLGRGLAAFGGVVGVVEADRDDLGRVRDRREQAHRLQRAPLGCCDQSAGLPVRLRRGSSIDVALEDAGLNGAAAQFAGSAATVRVVDLDRGSRRVFLLRHRLRRCWCTSIVPRAGPRSVLSGPFSAASSSAEPAPDTVGRIRGEARRDAGHDRHRHGGRIGAGRRPAQRAHLLDQHGRGCPRRRPDGAGARGDRGPRGGRRGCLRTIVDTTTATSAATPRRPSRGAATRHRRWSWARAGIATRSSTPRSSTMAAPMTSPRTSSGPRGRHRRHRRSRGIIGEIGCNQVITSHEERSFRAAARAHLRTGVTITTHAAPWPIGLAGSTSSSRSIETAAHDRRGGHLPDDRGSRRALARRGAWIQFDVDDQVQFDDGGASRTCGRPSAAAISTGSCSRRMSASAPSSGPMAATATTCCSGSSSASCRADFSEEQIQLMTVENLASAAPGEE